MRLLGCGEMMTGQIPQSSNQSFTANLQNHDECKPRVDQCIKHAAHGQRPVILWFPLGGGVTGSGGLPAPHVGSLSIGDVNQKVNASSVGGSRSPSRGLRLMARFYLCSPGCWRMFCTSHQRLQTQRRKTHVLWFYVAEPVAAKTYCTTARHT